MRCGTISDGTSQLAAELEQMQRRQLPEGWDADLPRFEADAKGLATRVSGGKVLNALGKNIPWLVGGSADLAPSTKTLLTFESAGDFSATDRAGRNLHFGIREHAMAAALNGMVLCGMRPYGATFFVFSDYLRPSLRLSALMQSAHTPGLHARLNRCWRRWADTPAGRTVGRRAVHPWLDRSASGGRE